MGHIRTLADDVNMVEFEGRIGHCSSGSVKAAATVGFSVRTRRLFSGFY
jgi:hypothetical protein